QLGLFGQANYSSSKAAIIALTKVSAREFARQNITVNAIAPGFIDVGMSKGMPDEVTQNFIKQIPLGRLGDVSEIVNAALFLASPMASYITGHVLNVNGGFYMGSATVVSTASTLQPQRQLSPTFARATRPKLNASLRMSIRHRL